MVPKNDDVWYTDTCQNKDKVNVGETCDIQCPASTTRVGPSSITCDAHNTWSAGGSYCKGLFMVIIYILL